MSSIYTYFPDTARIALFVKKKLLYGKSDISCTMVSRLYVSFLTLLGKHTLTVAAPCSQSSLESLKLLLVATVISSNCC